MKKPSGESRIPALPSELWLLIVQCATPEPMPYNLWIFKPGDRKIAKERLGTQRLPKGGLFARLINKESAALLRPVYDRYTIGPVWTVVEGALNLFATRLISSVAIHVGEFSKIFNDTIHLYNSNSHRQSDLYDVLMELFPKFLETLPHVKQDLFLKYTKDVFAYMHQSYGPSVNRAPLYARLDEFVDEKSSFS